MLFSDGERTNPKTPPPTLMLPLQSLNTRDNISAPTFTRKSRRGDFFLLSFVFCLSSPGVESNFFYISIHGNDIDLGSATQWAHTVPGPRNGAIFRPPYDAATNEAGKFRGRELSMVAAVVFSPLVTVNNLGRRRFIAPHSKCFRRIRVLWPSYWSNWEDVQQSKRNSWEPHRMHSIRKTSGHLLAYGGPFKLL